MLWTLAFSGSVSLAAALAFAYVGTRFLRRGHGEDAAAARAFAAWWIGIGAYTGVQGIEDLLGATGLATGAVFVPVRYATLVLICVAFAGLAHYVLFVRTGDARWARSAWAYYAMLALAFLVLVARGHPRDVVIQRWRTDVDYGATIDVTLLALVVLLAMAPVIAATIAYLGLGKRAADAEQRRRIRVIGASLLVWLVGMAASRLSQNDAFQLVARPIFGVGLALAVASVVRTSRAGGPRARGSASPRNLALRARMRELV